MFLRHVFAIGGLIVLCASSALAVSDPPEIYRQIFNRLDVGEAGEARELAKRSGDKLIQKYVLWADLTRSQSPASLDEIQEFIDQNPDWPGQSALRREAESAMTLELSNQAVIRWFKEREPVSREGKIRLAEALRASNRAAEADQWLRRAWIEDVFSAADENLFLERYRAALRPADQAAKLDRQLWRGQAEAATRQLKRVDPDVRTLGEARLKLQAAKGGVDKAVAAVPGRLQNDPGLLFDRIRWNRQKGNHQAARTLMLRAPADTVRPDLWWDERHLEIRDAMDEKAGATAYRLAAEHRLPPTAADYVQAEFLAGWIAFRLLDKPASALAHFQAVSAAATLPATRSRGAFWSARALDALGKTDEAVTWYVKAADAITTFYGQLAAVKLGQPQLVKLPADPMPKAAEREAFNGREIARLVRRLAELGEGDRTDSFIMRLGELSKTAEQGVLVTDLARAIGRIDLAVQIARRLQREGVILIESGYPVLPIAPDTPAEPALIHALIRQESSFHTAAVSRAGAQGLMQLMPGTAKAVAAKLKLPFAPTRLQEGEYNMQLGQAYLGEVLNGFSGSYVLSIAAYNAGPARVRQWLREMGDPRSGKIDVLDWIEQVPFTETRTYIQRVLEALQVYRLRLAGKGQRIATFGSFEPSANAAASWCLIACSAWATPPELRLPPDDPAARPADPASATPLLPELSGSPSGAK